MFIQRAVLILLCAATTARAYADDGRVAAVTLLDQGVTFFQDQGLAGALRFNYFSSSRSLDNETGFFGGTAQVKLRPVFNSGLDGKIEARLNEPDVGRDRSSSSSTLLEGYITAHFAKADLRIGKQIVAWGRADGINPTDNLTPHDFTVLLPFEEDQRFGTVAAKLDVAVSTELMFTFFTTPFFEPAKIPQPSSSAPPLEDKPAQSLSNSEVGIKLDKTGGAFDGSLSYYRGFDLLPDLRMRGMTATGPVLTLQYNRIEVLGVDAARNFGRYGFRGEAAYVRTRDSAGRDPTLKNPYLFYVLGVDRTFLENLNINLQFVGRSIQHFQDPEAIADPILRTLAVQNAIFANQQDRTSQGLSSRIGNKWFNDTLEAEVLLFVNFQHTNAFIRPLLTYAFNDHTKGTFGGEYYRGPDDSPFGQLKPNRGVFAEFRYSF